MSKNPRIVALGAGVGKREVVAFVRSVASEPPRVDSCCLIGSLAIMTSSTEEYDYIAYVDEAGDPGLKKVAPLDEGGSSEWLILSAVVMKAKREVDIADWLLAAKKGIAVDIRGPLHFRNLSPTRRLAVAKRLASHPVRAISVCSNKKNMRGWRNVRAEKIPSQEWFYNWCLRMLLERLTAFCDARRTVDLAGRPCKIKIEFSRRGGAPLQPDTGLHSVPTPPRERG